MRAAVLCVIAACSAAPAVAAPSCNLQHVSFPFDVYDDSHRWIGTRDFEMVLSHDTCRVRRVVTPHLACELSIGTSHGSRGFACGKELRGSWRMRDVGDQRSYFDTIGDGAHAATPSVEELKKIYAHLGDDDAAKPIYKEDFPRTFTSIGPRASVDNPDFQISLQPLRYRTMAGEDRLAFSADAVVGCVKYQFGVILGTPPPGHLDGPSQSAERDLSTFLGDLRLEPVEDPVPALQPLHTSLTKEALLAPILACYGSGNGGTRSR